MRSILKKKILAKIIKKNNKLSDIDFMSKHIWIINKNAERQLLTLNEIQLKIEETILNLQNQGIPPRIIVLKARQEGVSTYVQGKMIANTTQKKDRNGLIVAHKDKSVVSIFKKTKFMYENLDDDIKPLRKASNSKELIFDKPSHYKGNKEGINSNVSVQIAGDEDIGRGDTVFYVHLSEFAFWKGKDNNSPESQLTAISQAVPKVVDSWIIIESTAKGFNAFKDIWDKAISGENGWTPLFFAWHDMKEYTKEFKSAQEKQNFIETMDVYEKEIQQMFDLTFEQLNWYRHKKKTDCNNNPDKMKQENPSFPDEAFIFSGIPVFNNDLIIKRIEYLQKEYKSNHPKNGFFIDITKDNFTFKYVNNSMFEGEKVSTIIIYEEPKQGYKYVIGADTKGEGRDSYSATVINNITGDRVATLKMNVNNSKPFTMQLHCLGKYYNNALIGVEINFNTAPMEDLIELGYPNQYLRREYDKITKKIINEKVGWRTDGNTRPVIIDREVLFVDENINCFNDINTLREMLTFVNDKNGRPDAMSGKHDDLLFSDMIGQEIRKYQSTIISTEKEKPKPKLLDKLKKNR